MPRFSVVVPIYKVEAFLSKCIESILAQSYDDFELVLVDDGSPDNCPLICDEYAKKDDRIHVIHTENGGVGSARIAGEKKACGDYVCCVDGDDWVHPDYLKKFAEAICKYEPDIICCGYFLAYDESQTEVPFSGYSEYYDRSSIEKNIFPFLIQNEFCVGFPPSVWAKAIKRELYVAEQVAVPSQIKMGEDGAVVVPCLYNAGSMSVVEDCLYFYRQVATSLTKNKKPFDWEGPYLRYIHRNERMDLDCFDFREQQYRSTVHSLFNVVTSQFYRKENYFKIVKDIKQHLKNPVYDEAIRSCRFKSKKGRFAALALKYRLCGLIWLYSRIK